MHTCNGSTAAIERHALDIAAEFERRAGPFRAQIISEATPAWYVIRTAPGRENTAAEHLERRCIGLFLPRFVKGSRLVSHNRLIDLGDKLIFPGLVFVFVWDILAHWRRIKACPGVVSIMVDGSERPIVLKDEQIGRIQILQYELAVSRSKRRKRYRSAQDRLVISTVSHWRVNGEGV